MPTAYQQLEKEKYDCMIEKHALQQEVDQLKNHVESLRISSDGWNYICKEHASTIKELRQATATLTAQLKEAQEKIAQYEEGIQQFNNIQKGIKEAENSCD